MLDKLHYLIHIGYIMQRLCNKIDAVVISYCPVVDCLNSLYANQQIVFTLGRKSQV